MTPQTPQTILRGAVLALLVLAGCRGAAPPSPLLPPRKTPPTGPASATGSVLPVTTGWERAGLGLEYRVSEVAGGLAQVVALQADPALLSVQVWDARQDGLPGERAREFAKRHGAVAVINGGFFDEDREPLGLLIHRGERRSKLRKVDWGIFLVAGGKARIVHTREGVPAGTREALQCGPRLVIAGRVPRFRPGESQRSGVGVTAEGRVVLAAISRGELSLADFARVLKAWGCRDALNLDGGPSSQLYAKWGVLTLDLPGLYGVPNAIALVER